MSLEYEDNSSIYHSVLLSAFVAYIFYYLKWVVKKPTILCNERLHRFLECHVPILGEKFWPVVWCIEARCQTIIRNFIGAQKQVAYRREQLYLSDGGVIALDWALEEEQVKNNEKGNNNISNDDYDDDGKPIVVILPGLTGSSKENYVLRLAIECLSLGYRCVVFNYRGNGGVELKTPKTYSATDTTDLESVIAHVCSRHPKAPVMAIGVSLGGIILTNFLAKFGDKCTLRAAMTISVPWNVKESARSLEQPLNFAIFNKTLTNSLKQSLARHAHHFANHFDLDHVFKSSTIRDFDERFTSKVFGFEDCEDYYRAASIHSKVHDIKVPLLSLNSEDDPFAPLHSVPGEEAVKSSHVAIVLTSRGGHIGFLEGLLLPRSDGFTERVFNQYSSAVFNHGDKLPTAISA